MPKKDGTPTAAEKKAAQYADDQHPALDGADGVEVAKRSQDVDTADTTTHRKTFVVLKAQWEGTVDQDARHLANIEATRQAMIGQGLRPTADGAYAGSEDDPDGVSLRLHYDVPATAAVVAVEETVAHAHVTLDDQHAAEK